MVLVLEIAMAVAFVATSGLLFSDRFRRNYVVIGLTSMLGIASIYLTFFHNGSTDGPFVTNSPLEKYRGEVRGEPFTRQELVHIVDRTFYNVCRTSCIICPAANLNCDLQNDYLKVLKLPLFSNSTERGAYLVSYEEKNLCGSAGCPNLVLIISSDGEFAIAHEDWGVSDETAMLVAREAILRPMQ